jgi:hypothetical protein
MTNDLTNISRLPGAHLVQRIQLFCDLYPTQKNQQHLAIPEKQHFSKIGGGVKDQNRYSPFLTLSLFLSRKTSNVTQAFHPIGEVEVTVDFATAKIYYRSSA